MYNMDAFFLKAYVRRIIICLFLFHRLDLTQWKWEQLPDMLCPRDYFAAVCLDAKVFVLGGNYDDNQYTDDVQFYSPEENTWRCMKY